MKKAEIPIIDLHNDLLSFLTDKPGRTPEDSSSRSSYAQFSQGNVKLQTLAIFAKTGNRSVEKARTQIDQLFHLLSHYPHLFAKCQMPLYRNNLKNREFGKEAPQNFDSERATIAERQGRSENRNFEVKPTPPKIDSSGCFGIDAQASQVSVIPAFENASGFASEDEPLSAVFKRLEDYVQLLGPIFYIGMTWEHENRFGGGNTTTVGLKSDGKELLEWMSGKKIAIDLSHTSDALADQILNAIDKLDLDVPVIASHSNFRAISAYPRNLPEELAKEVVRRKGLIGLNFFAPFIHESDPSVIVRHVEYALHLGAGDALCFGADFFCDSDFPYIMEKYRRAEAFYPQFSNSSFYPTVLELFAKKLSLSQDQLLKIACQNALLFLKEKILSNKSVTSLQV